MIVQIPCPSGGTLIVQMGTVLTCLRLQHLENTTSSIRQGELSMGTVKALEMTCLVSAPVSSIRSHGCPQPQGGQKCSPHVPAVGGHQ